MSLQLSCVGTTSEWMTNCSERMRIYQMDENIHSNPAPIVFGWCNHVELSQIT
jgi:hypothetical protein